MKNLLVFFVIFVVVFSFQSCQKDEVVTDLNSDLIKNKIAEAPLLSKEEVQLYVNEKNLKSASTEDDATLVEMFQLDQQTFVVYESEAIKYYVYYEIDSNGYRRKLLTVKQIFPVVNGDVNLYQYSIDFEVGCPFSREFYLKNSNNVNQITYFFRSDDGQQFAYFSNGNNNTIKLPPIQKGKWQLSIVYDDGDLRQEFSTEMIDYYNQSNELQLKLQLKEVNVVSLVEFNKSYLKGSYLIRLIGRDLNGNYVYQNYPVLYDNDLKETVSYNASFDIDRVYICSMNGCWGYNTKIIGIRGNISIFALE